MNIEKRDLRALLELVDGVINGAEPSVTERDLVDMRLRLAHAFAEPVVEKGEKVFEWRIPLAIAHVLKKGKNKGKTVKKKMAPTMNDLVAMNIWERSAVRERLDDVLKDVIAAWPKAGIQDSPRPRCVRVTRFSRMEPDELGVDVLGGKVPIDRMVLAGILAGDTKKLLHREAHWGYVPGKEEGALLIEVFEVRGAT